MGVELGLGLSWYRFGNVEERNAKDLGRLSVLSL